MPISQIVKQKCKVCDALAVEKSRINFGSSKLITLECGHVVSEEILKETDYSSIISTDGKTLMPFQIETVKFAEKSNCRVLVAHEQGLGKTVIANALLSLHFESLAPVVIATKATIKQQWMKEIKRWTNKNKIQILFSGKEIAVPGMDVYITSYAMLAKEDVWAFIEPKTLILDECQQITNHLASRSKGAQAIGVNCEHIIGLSGTPIRNHAGEYFTILNLIAPKVFPEYTRFIKQDCDSYETQFGYKVGGLKDPVLFKEKTKDFIIRFTQEEVLPDLFALQLPRKFHHVELDKKLNRAYESASTELESLFYSDDESSFDKMTHYLAIMNRMRQITGVSKTIECTDFVTEFLLSTDRKIAIFAHHHVAVNLLETKLNQWLKDGGFNPCVMCRAGDDSSKRIEELSNPNSRVIILSGLASGEGMDGLQKICSDLIILERFWNPASEEQIEKRLVRMGQERPVNITYMIAAGTIDDYFTDLVEQKRAIVSSTLDGKEIQWDQNSLLSELVNVLVTTGKKRWTM